MPHPPFNPVIASLPYVVPFVGPEALERARGKPFRARLGANESIFGPSPLAIAAMEKAASENWKYSDPENHELRTALSAFHGIGLENVVVGEGIDGLLGLTCMMFLSPGETVVTTEGAYPTFNFHVAAHGGSIVKVPMRDDREDLRALLDMARRECAKLLYVSNPNNPMGSCWDAAAIRDLIANLPAGTLLILDEAYCDTAPSPSHGEAMLRMDGEKGSRIDTSNPQVIRYRTFSKAYGLAGARIGYAVGQQDVIQTFEKVRNHYGINRVGQVGALAAFQDQAYLVEAVARIARARDRISEIARANGLLALASGANFVAIDCGRDGVFAKYVLDGLLARDVFVRKPAVAPQDRCIRVSCGRDEDLGVFAQELPRALKASA